MRLASGMTAPPAPTPPCLGPEVTASGLLAGEAFPLARGRRAQTLPGLVIDLDGAGSGHGPAGGEASRTWWAQMQRSVWPPPVVMRSVCGKHPAEVLLPEDQHPVGEFRADGQHPAGPQPRLGQGRPALASVFHRG